MAVGVAVAATTLVGALTTVTARQEDPFPHEDHAGLFPLCVGCHVGVESGEAAQAYPPASQCAGCHDGVDEEVVAWEGPSRAPSNVVFDHVEHAADLLSAGDSAQSCESCHSASTEQRMAVDDREELATCFACHAHQTDDHFDLQATCESCHVPLADAGLGLPRREALEPPATHDDPLFLAEEHGRLAPGYADRCATCHTRDRCVSCHVDSTLREIDAIPAAPPTMVLPSFEARYPEPASHLDEGWLDAHQLQAPVRECSTCHTQDDCRSCHVGVVPSFVERLPSRSEATAPGVGLTPRAPESHASLFFMDAHASLAAADVRSCQTCHEPSYCVDCHDGPADGGYHPSSFVARHAADAFARSSECATCHSTEVFCRACHEESGLGSSGRLGAGYHDAEPLWLLRHGQPARQELESCASCHRQSDCVQCHGVLGAFSVSPHTRDFDAEEAWRRSPSTCLACHVGRPIGGVP